mgnify:CR=1 FL=1
MYAEDTVIYFTGGNLSTIKSVLQEDLNNVEHWMTENQLVLNQSKTKGLLFVTRQKLKNTDVFALKIRGEIIERVFKSLTT